MRLIASDISCSRGGRVLYDRLSFSLGDGELLLLTGPNGAGKTSLLRQIAGLLPLDHGRIVFEGCERAEEIHFVGHGAGVRETLTVAENLEFWRDLYGRAAESLEASLARLNLASLAALPARVLSAGQKRRLSLSRLVAIRRKLWLLDEPDTALDAEGRATLLALIAAHRADGGMIVMASHGTLAVTPSREIAIGARVQVAAA
ncbi:MAG TPA: heme ABC exporter ATP-binding protein CcmA [Xanthobacteraceae bacterium]|nr:heme ABC exporter ATP-binding protein CcmA [Xanthobacteraceae bacterium]